MSPSYDCAASLLCVEDRNSILCFDGPDDYADVENGEEDLSLTMVEDAPRRNIWKRFSLSDDFPLQSDEHLVLMAKRENELSPRPDYVERLMTGLLDASIRRQAVDWISKVNGYYNFNPVTASLSINYLDRFLSRYELPQGIPWTTQLLSVACLSLAAKVEETHVPLALDLQVGEAKYVFEAKTIQRMELLVLSTLKWRLQAVTPFSFIDYFLHKFGGGDLSKVSLARVTELIMSSARGISFLAFRPSEISASVALKVLMDSAALEVEKVVASCEHVDKESVLKCYEMIQNELISSDSKNARNSRGPVVPQSPVGVLDACMSNNSSTITTNFPGICDESTPASKKRKTSRSLLS